MRLRSISPQLTHVPPARLTVRSGVGRREPLKEEGPLRPGGRWGDGGPGANLEALRSLFSETANGFRSRVRSVEDVLGLVRADTVELRRYLLALERASRHARMSIRESLRLCDLGGYFGVFAASARRFGYVSDVVDIYGGVERDASHHDLHAWWADHAITPHDIDLQDPHLRLPFADAAFDVVALLAVIEHFHSTPRLVLEESRRILRPDGLLLIDTPNAAAFGTRLGFFLHGEGIWSAVSDLYASDIPFAGHKRCYSRPELLWTLRRAGFDPTDVVMLDLNPPIVGGSLRRLLLYRLVYRQLERQFPDLRNYVSVAARPMHIEGGESR